MNYILGFFTFLLFSISPLICQPSISESDKLEIDTYVDEALEKFGIPGVACAIIKKNKVVYKNYSGKANLEYNMPIAEESMFRLHSLSKIFVAVGIFQLVENNKIKLDDQISLYLEGLPEEWQSITIAHLLSHSSGLPDMREETNPSEEVAMDNVYKKKIQFEKGSMVSYNQTNFWLLNRIIRQVTSAGFEEFVLDQFQKDSKACFSNIYDIVANRVIEYNPNEKGQLQHYQFIVAKYMYGAGGLTLTLDDFIDWDKSLKENKLISSLSMNEMLKEFEYQIESSYAFTHGWFIQNVNNIQSYGFNGGGLANYRTFPSKDLSIVWLTNGYTVPYDLDNVTNTILGFIDQDFKDNTDEAQKLIYVAFNDNSEKEAIDQYEVTKSKFPNVNFESALNSIGYAFLGEKNIVKAISVFRFNTVEYPMSANTYDSLGEAYFIAKKFTLSMKSFQKSLELNPSNQNAKNFLTKLKQQSEK